MSVDLARQRFRELAQRATGIGAQSEEGVPLVSDNGKLIAHSLFPDEFEFYMMGFELIDNTEGERRVTDRFIFPVNPENIKINKRKIMTLGKSAGGISAFINNSFEPVKINITGTFGRKFRLLFGNKEDLSSQAEGPYTGNQGQTKEFVPNVKTGYGALKRLERLYEKATKAKEGAPYFVIFYNLAFNEAFFVEIEAFQPSMSTQRNMIWEYALSMTAVAPATSSLGRLRGKLKGGAIKLANERINRTADLANRITSRAITGTFRSNG